MNEHVDGLITIGLPEFHRAVAAPRQQLRAIAAKRGADDGGTVLESFCGSDLIGMPEHCLATGVPRKYPRLVATEHRTGHGPPLIERPRRLTRIYLPKSGGAIIAPGQHPRFVRIEQSTIDLGQNDQMSDAGSSTPTSQSRACSATSDHKSILVALESSIPPVGFHRLPTV